MIVLFALKLAECSRLFGLIFLSKTSLVLRQLFADLGNKEAEVEVPNCIWLCKQVKLYFLICLCIGLCLWLL